MSVSVWEQTYATRHQQLEANYPLVLFSLIFNQRVWQRVEGGNVVDFIGSGGGKINIVESMEFLVGFGDDMM